MFNGYDFIYDGKSSISENVKMLYTDVNPFQFTKSIPDKEISMYHANRSSKWNISGVTVQEPLSFKLEIMVHSDDIDFYENCSPVIERNRISRISHWLFDNVQFKKLQILTDDLRDLYFMVIFKDVEYFTAGGDVCGFRATAVCDTIGAWEDKTITKRFTGTPTDVKNFYIQVLQDGIYEVAPTYIIKVDKANTFDLVINDSDGFILRHLVEGSTITIDTERLIATSDVPDDNLYAGDKFDRGFPRLKYGKNTFGISVDGTVTFTIKYKSIREVGC